MRAVGECVRARPASKMKVASVCMYQIIFYSIVAVQELMRVLQAIVDDDGVNARCVLRWGGLGAAAGEPGQPIIVDRRAGGG